MARFSSNISNFNFSGEGGQTITIQTPVLTVENGAFIEGSTFGSGDGAAINIDVQRLVIQNGGHIDSGTGGEVDLGNGLILPASTGAGGEVTIDATESVVLSGNDVNLHDGTSISASTQGLGDAGQININSPSIELGNRAVISGFTSSSGRGGTINLNTDTLTITGNGFVTADSGFADGIDPESVTGQAGDVVVNAGRVELTGTGDGPTGLRSASSTAGDGGSVRVTTDELVMSSGAQVTARADGSGNAGDVTIDARNFTMDTGASIETRAAEGDGGNIVIGGGDLMYMNDAAITTSVESGVGSGGNITVEPRISVLDSSEIRADAFGGDGGNIDLNSQYLIATPTSVISASSELGNAGVINVAAPDIAIVASLTSLPADFLAAATLFRPRCEVRETDQGSSLVVVNRVGVPASPEGLLLAYDAPESLDGPSSVADEPRQELMAALTVSSEGSRALHSGQFDDAVSNFEQASLMYAEAGDPAARDQALRSLSQAQQASGDYEGSVTTLDRLLSAAEESEDEAGVAQALASLGNAYIALEQPERAREHLSRGVMVAIEAERPEIAALNLNNLANLEVTEGRYDAALGRYKESAELALNAGDRLQAAKALANGARVLLRANQLDATRELLEEARNELRPSGCRNSTAGNGRTSVTRSSRSRKQRPSRKPCRTIAHSRMRTATWRSCTRLKGAMTKRWCSRARRSPPPRERLLTSRCTAGTGRPAGSCGPPVTAMTRWTPTVVRSPSCRSRARRRRTATCARRTPSATASDRFTRTWSTACCVSPSPRAMPMRAPACCSRRAIPSRCSRPPSCVTISAMNASPTWKPARYPSRPYRVMQRSSTRSSSRTASNCWCPRPAGSIATPCRWAKRG
jgi:tetratricopeptide (TPR) repeat protein